MKKDKLDIKSAIKRPGALNKLVGGKASENIEKVRWYAEHGTPLQQHQARFYLNNLRPINKRNKKSA